MRVSNWIAVSALALGLAACGTSEENEAPAVVDAAAEAAPSAAPEPAPESAAAPESGAMDTILAGAWRGDDSARDAFRNPAETLAFFGVEPTHTVVELWPGSGWYSRILAPYLAAGGGQFIGAGFDPASAEGERAEQIATRMQAYADSFAADPDLYGTVEVSALSNVSGPIAAAESADYVLTFRNIHNWMSGEYLDKVMADSYAALKPGGVLGVVEHRLPSTAEQDPVASTGYVHEAFVIAAAERAGFLFEASSEVNANPADTADHPFGVWTLPPRLRDTDREGNSVDGYDQATYVAIGESDRMTLKFIKPE